MRALPVSLILALAVAALALSSTPVAAGPPPTCGIDGDGDFVCHVEAGGCEAGVLIYDVEDHPPVIGAGCPR